MHLLPEEVRTYRLLKLNLTLTEIDESAGYRNDWLLAIDDEYRKAEAEAQKRANGG